ncbi:hypothetical protein [uncultured Desulfovibrio sp.]|uniref:head-tail joining protein n=1 Tax=uncultured Desulfovibrio sp. TaxID=167968 RepID=UPI0025EC5549|nr:hypothetical protein [uncultured Desulfovibrio sp.]
MANDFLDALEADTATVLADSLGGAEDVELHPGGDASAAVVLRGFYGGAGIDSKPEGVTAPVISVVPMLHVPLVAVTSAIGRQLSRRDVLIVRNKRWRPENFKDDGQGLLVCKLLEAGETVTNG